MGIYFTGALPGGGTPRGQSNAAFPSLQTFTITELNNVGFVGGDREMEKMIGCINKNSTHYSNNGWDMVNTYK